jgi:hypothetical protein
MKAHSRKRGAPEVRQKLTVLIVIDITPNSLKIRDLLEQTLSLGDDGFLDQDV